jgi:hypothetical protein
MREVRAEKADVAPRPIVATGIVLVLTILAVAGAAYGLLATWQARIAGPNAPLDFAIREPVLESAPQLDRARFDAEKRALVGGYAWVDRGRGIARIPVEAAMDLMVRRDASHEEAARR